MKLIISLIIFSFVLVATLPKDIWNSLTHDEMIAFTTVVMVDYYQKIHCTDAEIDVKIEGNKVRFHVDCFEWSI